MPPLASGNKDINALQQTKEGRKEQPARIRKFARWNWWKNYAFPSETIKTELPLKPGPVLQLPGQSSVYPDSFLVTLTVFWLPWQSSSYLDQSSGYPDSFPVTRTVFRLLEQFSGYLDQSSGYSDNFPDTRTVFRLPGPIFWLPGQFPVSGVFLVRRLLTYTVCVCVCLCKIKENCCVTRTLFII